MSRGCVLGLNSRLRRGGSPLPPGDPDLALAIQRMAVERRLCLASGLQLRFALLLFRGKLLGLLQRLALGLRFQAGSFFPRLGALLLALFLARGAFAADRFQIGFEVIGAVVVIDLLARLDVLDGA